MRFVLILLLVILAVNGRAQVWETLNKQSLDNYKQGRYTQAMAFSLQAMAAAEREYGKLTEQYVNSLTNTAYIQQASGDFKAAQRSFRRSIQMLELLLKDDHIDKIEALTNLGNAYIPSAQYDSSEFYFLAAQAMITSAMWTNEAHYKDKIHRFYESIISIQNSLASLYHKKGQFEKATRLLEETLQSIRETYPGDYKGLYMYKTTLANLNTYYIQGEDAIRAKATLLEYMDIVGDVDDSPREYVNSLQNLGSVYRMLEQFDSAAYTWTKAEALMEGGLFKHSDLHQGVLINLGEMYLAVEDYAKAIRYLVRAKEMQENLASVNPRFYQNTLFNLAESYRWNGDFPAAHTVYRKLIGLLLKEIRHNFTYLSDAEKISFFRSQYIIVDHYLTFALEVAGVLPLQKQTYRDPAILNDLYDLQLATKGLILTESHRVRSFILNGNDTTLQNQYERWQQKKNQLASLYGSAHASGDEIYKLEVLIEDLEKLLSRRSALFKQGFLKDEISWKHIQQHLKPGEAAVEMIRVANGLLYAAMIITPGTKTRPVVSLVVSTKSKHLEKQFFNQYANGIRYQLSDTVSYVVYWKPVVDSIERYMPKGQKLSRIYFAADGIYNQINLNTLYNPASRQYVIDEASIQTVTSTKAIVRKRDTRSGARTAALFGAPSFTIDSVSSRELFGNLPGTELEIDKTNQYLLSKKWTTKVYKHRDATESNVKKLASPGILHLATHGFFTNDNAQRE
ncbi:MAG TPA: tetratricopeptide repeat protein, partial [Ohtaekwangia sp.]|nr:tetratricopeptide repeat protein [Ohtaekwangia sp.]